MGGNVTNTRHIVRNCVAWRNKASGFYSNHSTDGHTWYNNTALQNGTNFNMLSGPSNAPIELTGALAHILRTNIGYPNKNSNMGGADTAFNTWDLPAVRSTQAARLGAAGRLAASAPPWVPVAQRRQVWAAAWAPVAPPTGARVALGRPAQPARRRAALVALSAWAAAPGPRPQAERAAAEPAEPRSIPQRGRRAARAQLEQPPDVGILCSWCSAWRSSDSLCDAGEASTAACEDLASYGRRRAMATFRMRGAFWVKSFGTRCLAPPPRSPQTDLGWSATDHPSSMRIIVGCHFCKYRQNPEHLTVRARLLRRTAMGWLRRRDSNPRPGG